jgi:hypothetical protein
MDFGRASGRSVVAAFSGGLVASDAGSLLRAWTDRALRLVERFAACFRGGRDPDLIEHAIANLIGQRVFGLAPSYEDPNDHDDLRRDPGHGGGLAAGNRRAVHSARPRGRALFSCPVFERKSLA